MKTIKIIDLLNKIANEEEVPKQIKYNNLTYEYYCSNYYLEGQSIIGLHSIYNDLSHSGTLNDEVEIIEEKEKAKKIEEVKSGDIVDYKINEIIQAVNYLLEKDKEK